MGVGRQADIPAEGTARRRGRPPSPERRAALVDLAAAMFAKEGYHGTSIRDLAERAGMNAATLYHYFKSKEDALFEVCLAGAAGSATRIEQALAAPATMPERLRRLLREQVADLAVRSDYRHVYFEQRSHLSDEQSAVIDQQTRRVRRALDTLFEEARANGELHETLSPRTATLTVAALLRSLTQFHVDGPIRDYDTVAAAMSETLIRGLSPGADKKDAAR